MDGVAGFARGVVTGEGCTIEPAGCGTTGKLATCCWGGLVNDVFGGYETCGILHDKRK